MSNPTYRCICSWDFFKKDWEGWTEEEFRKLPECPNLNTSLCARWIPDARSK